MGNRCPLKSVFESSIYQGFLVWKGLFCVLMKAQITRKNINLPKYFVVNYVVRREPGAHCNILFC